VSNANVSYVVVDGDSGPACPEDVAAVSVALTEREMSKPGPVETEVEAADPAEEADAGWTM
jgi:hypothetical protein